MTTTLTSEYDAWMLARATERQADIAKYFKQQRRNKIKNQQKQNNIRISRRDAN